jgi:hypothetical protein
MIRAAATTITAAPSAMIAIAVAIVATTIAMKIAAAKIAAASGAIIYRRTSGESYAAILKMPAAMFTAGGGIGVDLSAAPMGVVKLTHSRYTPQGA